MDVAVNDGANATAGAENVRKSIGAQEIVDRVLGGRRMDDLFGYAHDLISSRMSSGTGIAPPAWFSRSTGTGRREP